MSEAASKVFISYSSKDREIADYIVADLRQRGVEVFIDYQRLKAGFSWSDQLRDEILGCDYLVLLVRLC